MAVAPTLVLAQFAFPVVAPQAIIMGTPPVVLGRVSVPVFVIDAITGVVIVGEVALTTLPVPVEATYVIVVGSEVPVFSMNPVDGEFGRFIMNGVLILVGA